MDPEIQANIAKLEAFRGELRKWRDADRNQDADEHRAYINRHKRAIKRLMVDADCHRKVQIRVASEQGFVEEIADPFDALFDGPDSHDVVKWTIDMVDETIGELQHKAAAYDAFMADEPSLKEEHYAERQIEAVIEPPFLDMRLQRGRLELIDPPPESPVKLNRLRDELPNKLAAVTTALAELTEAVKRDNGFLGDLLKTQLVAMLKATVIELEAPHTDTSRLKATVRVLTGIAVEAGKKGGADFIKGQLERVADSLGELIKSLWQ